MAPLLLFMLAIGPAPAQSTFQQRADDLLDYLNTHAPNVGQTGGGPNRIGCTGFWYGQGRIARGNVSTGLSYISAAVGDADAEGANGLNLNLHAQYALPDFPGLPPGIMAAATGTLTAEGSASTSGNLAINGSGRFEVATGSSLCVGGSVTLAGVFDPIAPPNRRSA